MTLAADIYIDTSGFYALLVQRDSMHQRASTIMAQAARARTRFVTTDYVLDESVTLLKARGHRQLIALLFETLGASSVIRVEWTTAERFHETRAFCLHHSDKDWSFTDCLSFLVMRNLGLHQALTSDGHFRQAGFRVLLSETRE